MYKLAKKYLKVNISNTKAIILVSVLSVILVCISFSVKEQDYTQRKKMYYNINPNYDVILSATQKTAYETIKEDKDINDIGVGTENSVNVNGEIVNVQTYDKDKVERLVKVDILQGRMPENSSEVIISKDYENGIKETKDNIINLNGEELKVVGIYNSHKREALPPFYKDRNAKIIKLDSKENILNLNENIIYYCDYNYGSNNGFSKTMLINQSQGYNEKSYYKTNELIKSISSKEKGENEVLNATELEYENIVPTISIVSTLPSVAIIFIIFGFTVISIKNVFKMSIIAKVKLIGTLKAIGASPMQIIKLILNEVLILILISYPLGIVIGLILSKVVTILLSDIIGNEIYVMSVYNYIYIMISSFLILAGSILCGALDSIAVVRNLTVVESILSSKQYKEDTYIVGENSNFIKKHFGIEVKLADRNMASNASKYRSCFFSLGLAMFLIIIMVSILQTNKINAEKKYIQSNNWNIEMLSTNYITKETVEEIKAETNKEVYASSMENVALELPLNKIKMSFEYKSETLFEDPEALYKGNKPRINVRIVEGNKDLFDLCRRKIDTGEIDYDNFNIDDIILCDVTESQEKGDCISVFSRMTTYKVGDKIKLNDGKEYNIKAILSEEPLKNIDIKDASYSLEKRYIEIIKPSVKDNVKKLYLQCDKDKERDIIEKIEKMTKEKGLGFYNVNVDTEKLLEFNNKSFIVDMLFAIVIILVLIINLINTFTIAVKTRKGEIACLRAAGMSLRQVKKNIFAEGLIISLYSGFIGVGISSLVILMRKNSFFGDGINELTKIIIIILTIFLMQLVIGIFSSLKPIKNIIGNSIVDDIVDNKNS